jgi:hypothetical protein
MSEYLPLTAYGNHAGAGMKFLSVRHSKCSRRRAQLRSRKILAAKILAMAIRRGGIATPDTLGHVHRFSSV